MKKKKKTRKLESLIIKSIVALLILFSIVMIIIGYSRFTNTFTKEYNNFSQKIADTATAIINSDNLDQYLKSKGNDEEYIVTDYRLKILANKMDVPVIYVIRPDSDYEHYTNIFNVVSDKSGYTSWDIGSKKKTTNDEYKTKYKKLMEGKTDVATIIRTTRLNGALPHITTLVPLKNKKGNIVAILCVQRIMRDLTTARHSYVFSVTSFTFILVILVFIAALLFVRRQIVKPITLISDEAKRFSNKSELIDEKLINISKITEIESLGKSINKMEIDIAKYINNLTEITKEKERIGTELRLASVIQEESVPNEFPAYPDKKEFNLYASMSTAKEVGGDFYDFYLVDDNHLALVMADVSGKGIPAALFMMSTKILISENLLAHKSPKEVLNTVNNRVCQTNKTNMFITVWIGILEISTGKLVCSNAGHEYPIIYRNGKKFEVLKDKHGIVVGAFENYQYKEYELKLEKGDKIFVYTDGLVEATNSKNEMFGLDNTLASLNKLGNEDVKKTLEKLKKDVDTFVDEAVQFDDLTMLMLEYNGKKKVSHHE